METNQAFEYIAQKVEQELSKKGYERLSVAPSEKELTALFVGESAYSIIYTFSGKRMMLRSCELADGEPDNQWKTLATWLFDAETDSQREVESIASDFTETISGPRQTPAGARQRSKKKKKDGEQTVDALFLANRLVAFLPELKEEIAFEKNHYEDFRGVTFTEEKLLPLFRELTSTAASGKLEKISEVLASVYSAGDLETKGIITYLLLNSVDDDSRFQSLITAFSDNDKKVAKAARKLRGKKIKPEKVKKSRSYITDTLNNMQS